ncbi:hypothetical protein BX616_004777 [Lobosporangium transversale]|nr:hypothetical protein BX616_004777 [Lobosporangium transversale]
MGPRKEQRLGEVIVLDLPLSPLSQLVTNDSASSTKKAARKQKPNYVSNPGWPREAAQALLAVDRDIGLSEPGRPREAAQLSEKNILDIYNCDETGLFLQSTSNWTLDYDKVSGTKARICRKVSKMTSRFAHKLRSCLGDQASKLTQVSGKPGKKSSSSSRKSLRTRLQRPGLLKVAAQDPHRRVALVLDNAPSHMPRDFVLDQLRNVQLVFLPANSTSKTQPLDAGIIAVFKGNYKAECLQETFYKRQTASLHERTAAIARRLFIDNLTGWRLIARVWDKTRDPDVASAIKYIRQSLRTAAVSEATEGLDPENDSWYDGQEPGSNSAQFSFTSDEEMLGLYKLLDGFRSICEYVDSKLKDHRFMGFFNREDETSIVNDSMELEEESVDDDDYEPSISSDYHVVDEHGHNLSPAKKELQTRGKSYPFYEISRLASPEDMDFDNDSLAEDVAEPDPSIDLQDPYILMDTAALLRHLGHEDGRQRMEIIYDSKR